jgi:hypothetical protein
MRTMNIQKLTTIVFCIFSLPALLSAEYVQLLLTGEQGHGVIEYSNSIILAEGDSAELISTFSSDQYQQGRVGIEVSTAGITFLGGITLGSNGENPTRLAKKFIGPSTIRITNKLLESDTTVSPMKLLALFKIHRADSPENAIIVPDDDPAATFEVFIEASADLNSWVRAIPGDYDADGAARFFRVRMVKK